MFLRVGSFSTPLALVLSPAGARGVRVVQRPAASQTGEEEPNRVYLDRAAFQPGAWVVRKCAGNPDADIRQGSTVVITEIR
jgi:hypothetical protein